MSYEFRRMPVKYIDKEFLKDFNFFGFIFIFLAIISPFFLN